MNINVIVIVFLIIIIDNVQSYSEIYGVDVKSRQKRNPPEVV